MNWSLVLSNNEKIQQDTSDLSHWRKLVQRCKGENLQIKELYYDQQLINPKADAYFVIYDIFVPSVLQGGKHQFIKIGIGTIFESIGKCRIHWFPLKEYKQQKLPAELIKGIPTDYKELSIAKYR